MVQQRWPRMTVLKLDNRLVIVTRPALQASAFCAAIEASGGSAIRFPTIEIQPPTTPELASRYLTNLPRYDIIIYLSANAVRAAPPPRLLTAALFAVGQATAKALLAAGQPTVSTTTIESTSEALLSLPALQTVRDLKVLIVAGEDGRNILAKTLQSRGAMVEKAAVYRRTIPVSHLQTLDPVWSAPKKPVITLTSGDAARNLVSMIGTLAPKLLRLPIVAGSGRIAAICDDLGFKCTASIADNPGDSSMLEALQKLSSILSDSGN